MQQPDIQNAAAYIRVSTDRQEELSPDAQKRELLHYAAQHHIQIDDFYFDNGFSGKKADKRPAFQQMISRAKSSEHPYDCILVWKFSRFARNQEESIVYKSLLRKNHVEVISITEPRIDGPFASLIERIIEWMDEYYSIRLAGDVKRGMRERALRGGYQSVLPLGYCMNTQHIPEIYEPEAVIVREIYRLCEEKYSLTAIARMLNDMGYRTRRGNRFERRTVLYILQNPFYAGNIRWNRISHDNRYPNQEEDVVLAKGIHSPLFTEDTFNKIQTILETYTPGRSHCRQQKSETLSKHFLCGILKCPVCGKNMAYHQTKQTGGKPKNHPYFSCWQYSKGIHKNGGSISARRCEHALIESLQSLLSGCHIPIRFMHSDPPNVSKERILKYERALSNLEQKKKRIQNAYIDGIDTKEEYKANKSRICDEQNRLRHLIMTEKASPGIMAEEQGRTWNLQICNVLAMIQDPEIEVLKKHRAIAGILEKMEYKRETDTFYFYYLYS